MSWQDAGWAFIGSLMLGVPIGGLVWWLGSARSALYVVAMFAALGVVAECWYGVKTVRLGRVEGRRQSILSPTAAAAESQEIALFDEAHERYQDNLAAYYEYEAEARAEAQEIAGQRKREAADQETAMFSGEKKDQGGAEMLAAFGGLEAISKNHRKWLSMAEYQIRAAGQELGAQEYLQHVAVAQTGGIAFQAIVVTSARLFIIGGSRVEWLPRSAVTGGSSMPSVRGRHLALETSAGRKQWWEVEPKPAAAAIVSTVKSGYAATGPSSATKPSEYGATVASTTAKYLGGDFVGKSVRSRGGMPQKLTEGSMVKVEVTDGASIVIRRSGMVLAQYPLGNPAVVVDTTTSVSRGIRKGRLAATAAAVLLVAPVAAVGLAASTAKRVREDFAMVVEDADDYGVFAFTDAKVGARIAAAQRKAATPTTTPSSTPPPGLTAGSQLEQLERLQALRTSGALDDAEFQAMKRDVLGPSGEADQ